MNKYLSIEKKLEKAIRSNYPVVGLELSSISKQLPYPESLNLALHLEKVIRSQDCIPATMGIMKGKLKAGLTPDEISILLSKGDSSKISSRDIAYYISQGLSGLPSIAAVLIISKLAGIRVIATGAIGGVHRGAMENFDISADLQELTLANVAVVCSGVNYIFDIPMTLEYLKTRGVPIIGYATDIFPAFYVMDEQLKVEYRIDDPYQISSLIDVKWDLGLKGGVIVANQVPIESRIHRDTMETYIREAIDKAQRLHINRSNFTGYMVEEINRQTQGKTSANLEEILQSNTLLACNVSKGLSQLYIE